MINSVDDYLKLAPKNIRNIYPKDYITSSLHYFIKRINKTKEVKIPSGSYRSDIGSGDVNGDGLGGLFYLYNQCLGDVNVRLYLMTNMGHEWPTDNGQNDIVAANEIWYFLKDFDVNGKIIP